MIHPSGASFYINSYDDYFQIGHLCWGRLWWHAQSVDKSKAETLAMLARLTKHLKECPGIPSELKEHEEAVRELASNG